jgi:hypothetical protein
MNTNTIKIQTPADSSTGSKTTAINPAHPFCAKYFFLAAVLALGTLFTPATSFGKYSRNDDQWVAELGFLVHACGDFKGIGLNLRGICYISTSNRLTLDLNWMGDIDPKVTGRFSYIDADTYRTRDDGRIEIKQNVTSLMLGYEYELELSDRWAVRAGPVAGIAYVSASEEREPKLTTATNYFRSDSGTPRLYGANIGVRYTSSSLSDKLYWDFSLAALKYSRVNLNKFSEKMSLTGCRVIISAGWRF